jgi:hypothetical protein
MLQEDTLMKIEGRRIPPYHKVMISNGIDITSGDVGHLVLVLVAENQRSDSNWTISEGSKGHNII